MMFVDEKIVCWFIPVCFARLCASRFLTLHRCLLSLVTWLIGGTFWYMFWHEWPFFTALYYLIQAGMSVGAARLH